MIFFTAIPYHKYTVSFTSLLCVCCCIITYVFIIIYYILEYKLINNINLSMSKNNFFK